MVIAHDGSSELSIEIYTVSTYDICTILVRYLYDISTIFVRYLYDICTFVRYLYCLLHTPTIRVDDGTTTLSGRISAAITFRILTAGAN